MSSTLSRSLEITGKSQWRKEQVFTETLVATRALRGTISRYSGLPAWYRSQMDPSIFSCNSWHMNALWLSDFLAWCPYLDWMTSKEWFNSSSQSNENYIVHWPGCATALVLHKVMATSSLGKTLSTPFTIWNKALSTTEPLRDRDSCVAKLKPNCVHWAPAAAQTQDRYSRLKTNMVTQFSGEEIEIMPIALLSIPLKKFCYIFTDFWARKLYADRCKTPLFGTIDYQNKSYC